MHHHDKYAHSPREPVHFIPVPDGALDRILAAMAERGPARPAPNFPYAPASGHFSAYHRSSRETDRSYFRRRSREQDIAAGEAAGAKARQAHRQLSALYAERADPAPGWKRARDAGHLRLPGPGRAERQDALLDAALLETFPASDPVSVVLVD